MKKIIKLNTFMDIIVSIIGFAGKKHPNDNLLYEKNLFQKMCDKAEEEILLIGNKKHIILMSGGSSWSDHVAVKLYLTGDYKDLILYLPCEWKKDHFEDNGHEYWAKNPGKLLNYYHEKFSKIAKINSLEDIQIAIKMGATIKVFNGFHTRNTQVAKSDHLIAFGLNEGKEPVDGGTFDTWKKNKGEKIYVHVGKL